jgi:hypothetical protein
MTTRGTLTTGPGEPTGAAPDRPPELADVGRYGRRLVRRFVATAREGERPRFDVIIGEHLGVPVDRLPIAEANWPRYEHATCRPPWTRGWPSPAGPTSWSA